MGFFAEDSLKKVPIAGGPAVTLCRATTVGASWGLDDSSYFASSESSGIARVSASGGTPEPITTVDSERGEIIHRWPDVLPDGKGVLFTVVTRGGTDALSAAVVSLETGERRILVEEATNPRYASSGHVIFERAGSLIAVPFDLGKLEVTGQPVAIISEVQVVGGSAPFTLSSDGSLVYVPGPDAALYGLVLVDRQGATRPLTEGRRNFLQPRLSPDGRHIALSIIGPTLDVWVIEPARDTFTRLTFDGTVNSRPIWTPDGKWLTFRSNRAGPNNVFWKPADGSGPAVQLTTTGERQIPTLWSPDGRVLAFTDYDPGTGGDIWTLPIEDGGEPREFLRTPFHERHGMFSPDGRWLAYTSNESGRDEIYVQSYPGRGGKWLISNEGGSQPVWSRNGGELFYRNGNAFLAVAVETEPMFSAGRSTLLFEEAFDEGWPGTEEFSSNYDVTADGEHFVMLKSAETAGRQMNVVLNLFDELKRSVPAK